MNRSVMTYVMQAAPGFVCEFPTEEPINTTGKTLLVNLIGKYTYVFFMIYVITLIIYVKYGASKF